MHRPHVSCKLTVHTVEVGHNVASKRAYGGCGRQQWLAERIGRRGTEGGSWNQMLEKLDFRQKHVIHALMQ